MLLGIRPIFCRARPRHPVGGAPMRAAPTASPWSSAVQL